MEDILGRELKDGDLCVGMAIGRDSRGMHIGVFQGKSIVWYSKGYNGKCYINKSSTSNTYLIENPTEQELAIKEIVQKLLVEEQNERKKRNSQKTIPLGKLEVGGIYKDIQGNLYMYLGKRKVTFENLTRQTKTEEFGNCFVRVSTNNFKEQIDEKILKDVLDDCICEYSGNYYVDILKGNKKLTEMVRKIDLNFPLVKTKEYNRGWKWSKYKLTIE